MIDPDAARQRWHPVAASKDLPRRHVFHAQLLGRELALWRADDGNVNAWENRCLHRGVRLSIGINDGTELVCQYHGWRYANRTAGCTYIPAHPADAPARTICNNTYPVMEKQGLVWCSELPAHNPQWPIDLPDTVSITPLFAIPINLSLAKVADGLAKHLSELLHNGHQDKFRPLHQIDQFILSTDTTLESGERVILYLQPADAERTIVRGIVATSNRLDRQEKLCLLRRYSQYLNTCRRRIENNILLGSVSNHWQPVIQPVSEANASLPEISTISHQSLLRLRVIRADELTSTIKSFRLESIEEQLPTAQPGAHIDVHLHNGLIRQYSLINGPGQTDHYAIAVKNIPDSTGGSIALHQDVKVGDVIASSAPRNNFSLRRDALHTHLIAGGIGITPLLSMARALHHASLPFTLHYFVSHEDDFIFKQEIESFSGETFFYAGLSISETTTTLQNILSESHPQQHVYICGPEGLLSAARQAAENYGWPDSQIHFEYFKNTTQRNTSSEFKVELARSGLTLNVPGGKTLLQALREHTVALPSSCEQGACGTCKVSVLSGIPDHQDVYLSDTQKASNDCMMTCVSRAKTPTLVLDL